MIPFEIIGRFHPVLVHLPIGIFILVHLTELTGRFPRFSYLKHSSRFILLTGIIFSILSVISGYTLSLEQSNDVEKIELHQWMGITTTLLYVVYYLKKSVIDSSQYLNMLVQIILPISLIITGHKGGELTHGENFLTLNEKSEDPSAWKVPEITNIQEAMVFEDMVQYTLNTKCVSCHGNLKQKGKLRLDNAEWINKGGKTGISINRSNPSESELLKRILLDENDEYHMPPKEKSQLNEFEINILKWWILSGSNFKKRVAEMNPDSVMLKSIHEFKESLNMPKRPEKTRAAIEAPAAEKITEVQKSGWVITPISLGSHYLRITSFNLMVPINEALTTLQQIGENIVELKISATGLNDKNLQQLQGMKNIEKLWIDNNKISNDALSNLSNMKQLEFLNVAETKITAFGLENLLKTIPLKKIISSKTGISEGDKQQLKSKFSNLEIIISDTMHRFESDTIFKKQANTN
jgi:uncharacterized membrane protein